MTYDPQNTARNGLLAIDSDGSMPKGVRALQSSGAGEIKPESIQGLGDWGIRKISDPANGLLWENDRGVSLTPRGGWGSWSFAVPAMQQMHPNGTLGFIPLHSHAKQLDEDFKPLTNVLSVNYGELTPGKALSVVVATTGHGAHEPVAIMSGGPLVADWLSSKAPKYSRWLFDMTPGGDELDFNRKAGLHSALRVRKWSIPCSKYAGADMMAIALNFTRSRDNTGLGFAHFGSSDAYLSQEGGGPLTPATGTHEVGFGDSSIRAGAIQTMALYHGGDPKMDGPLPFTPEKEPDVQEGIFAYRAWLMWRPNFERQFLCGKRDGRWDLHVKIPVQETPTCNPTKTAVKDANGVPQKGFMTTSLVYTPSAYAGGSGFVGMVKPGNLKGQVTTGP